MPTTQAFLPIKEVREGVIILKDGNWKGVLAVSSVNFALMKQDEQDAIVYQYQNFLNSLDFPVQILVQSRKLNLSGYLKELKRLEVEQEIELLRIQAQNYREFIEGLSQMVNLMSKYFYIVVPFRPTTFATKAISEEEFQRWRGQLVERMNYIAGGLGRCGIKCKMLEQEEVLELLWGSFNLTEAEKSEVPIIQTL